MRPVSAGVVFPDGVALRRFFTRKPRPKSAAAEKHSYFMNFDATTPESSLEGRASLAAKAAALNRLFGGLNARLAAAASLRAAFGELLDAVLELLGADRGFIEAPGAHDRAHDGAHDGAGDGAMEIVAERGFDSGTLDDLRQAIAVDGAAAVPLKTRPIDGAERDGAPFFDRCPATAIGFRSVRIMPLLGIRGNPLGLLCAIERPSRRPLDRDLQVVDFFVRQAVPIIERFAVEEQLVRQREHYALVADERLELVTQLHRADRHKDEFIAVLAHELRNVLSPVRTAVDFLCLRESGDSNIAFAQEMIGRQVKQMTRLVDDMLDISRIARGQLSLRKQRIALEKILATAVDDSRPFIETKQHELTIHWLPATLELDADPSRLTQAFVNLLINAAKYTPAGGRIEVAIERRGGEALVAIRDSGIGISAGVLPHIFEMFTRGDDVAQRSGGGLGVGLTLVQRLVEMHGGRVEVHSDGLGQGSRFTVRLPLLDANGDGPPAPANSVAAAAPPAKHRIVVVDDNQDAANSLAIMLRLKGHDVQVAYDGRSALAAVETFRPELALLDIGLPDISGYDVARMIRERPCGAAIRLVALTGWGQPEDRIRALEAGFDRHLTKPAKLASIEALLDKTSPSVVG